MNYNYIARFIPSGCSDPSEASQIKKVNFSSDNRMPTKKERQKAVVTLQKEMDDAYVARNYWELYDYLINYNNPSWSSTTEVRRNLQNFNSPTQKVRSHSKMEEFLAVDHNPSVNAEDIRDHIESEYDVNVGEEQIEKVTGTTTKLYLRWKVEP